MFDISWTEFLLVGVVALIVIGPKELPGVLRTLGQYTRKVRSLAADFQNQFQEAMREAEMADLKKHVDDLAQDFKSFDPLKGVRDDVESAGKDIERSFERPAEGNAVTAAESEPALMDMHAPMQIAASDSAAQTPAEPGAADSSVLELPAPDSAVPDASDPGPLPEHRETEMESVGTGVPPVASEPAAEVRKPNTAEHEE